MLDLGIFRRTFYRSKFVVIAFQLNYSSILTDIQVVNWLSEHISISKPEFLLTSKLIALMPCIKCRHQSQPDAAYSMELQQNPQRCTLWSWKSQNALKEAGVPENQEFNLCTPYIQQPIKWGAHLVVHSATKLIDGQGRVLGELPLEAKIWFEKYIYFLEIRDQRCLHLMLGFCLKA